MVFPFRSRIVGALRVEQILLQRIAAVACLTIGTADYCIRDAEMCRMIMSLLIAEVTIDCFRPSADITNSARAPALISVCSNRHSPSAELMVPSQVASQACPPERDNCPHRFAASVTRKL